MRADLLHLLRRIQHGPDDHHSVQEVQGDAMRRGDILGAPAKATVLTWSASMSLGTGHGQATGGPILRARTTQTNANSLTTGASS